MTMHMGIENAVSPAFHLFLSLSDQMTAKMIKNGHHEWRQQVCKVFWSIKHLVHQQAQLLLDSLTMRTLAKQ